MVSQPKVVFFDLGGVVIDVQIEKFFSAVQNATHLEMQEVYRRMESLRGAFAEFQRGVISPETMYQQFCEKFPFRDDYTAFVTFYTNIFQTNQQVVDIIHQIAPLATLSVISNTDILHYQYLVQEYPVMSLFAKPVTSYEVGALKPERAIYQYALQTLDVAAEQCFFVDDKPENVAAAVDLGMKGMVFQDATSLRTALEIFLKI